MFTIHKPYRNHPMQDSIKIRTILIIGTLLLGCSAPVFAGCHELQENSGHRSSCCSQPGAPCHCPGTYHSNAQAAKEPVGPFGSLVGECPCSASPQPRNNPA